MPEHSETATGGWGLLAIGCAGRWQIDVTESLDRASEWAMEIEGPKVYLTFQLRDLNAVSEAARFLRVHLGKGAQREQPGWSAAEDTLLLGAFGSGSVSLMWDNEEFPRCFLVVGPKARSTLRLDLDKEDVQMMIEALDQVLKDLAPTSPERA
jgi:hypothetical protein